MLIGAKSLAQGGPSTILILIVILLLGLYVWICNLIARAAKRKGRSFGAWFAIAFFVSPLLAAIIIATVSSNETQTTSRAELVPCPRCAEPIRPAASACRFCGIELKA
jgi:hypothetical protein